MLAIGCGSAPAFASAANDHISSLVSSEKSALTAPARVPVASRGLAIPDDHANAAVRGISRSRVISGGSVWWGMGDNGSR